MKEIWSTAHGLYRPFPFIRCLAPQTPSPIFFKCKNMKFTDTYNRFNNYLLCITLKGREILINKDWLGVGKVGEDTFSAPSPTTTLPPPPCLPPSSDAFICSVDSTYTVGNHMIWMIGCMEFRAGIQTKKENRLTKPIFIKQAHIPPNYSKQTFISKLLHNMQLFSTQVWTNIVFSISTLLGLRRKITIYCRKTLRWMIARNNEEVCALIA